ncbi:MAG: HD domain-containing protein, partial [Clostridia bacterium]|nr:HD domain-containing protein [Clostridia bacterium]
MNRYNYETVAAIDVGSNTIRMLIAQVLQDGRIVPLEDLYKPTNIGRDTFATGRIQVSSIHELCETLAGFYKTMKQYRVRRYRAGSTSGIREAENKEYVLEQIRTRAGLEVEVINNAQDRYLMYKTIRGLIKDAKTNKGKNTLIVDIGSGGVEMSVYSTEGLKYTEYIKVGSLRLREMLADLERKTLDFPQVMEEFIESRIDYFKPLLSEMNINNFVGLGGELKSIISLSSSFENEQEGNFISREALGKIYNKVYRLTTSQIIQELGLERNQAEILLPSVILFYSFLKMTKAKGIYAPMSSLRHGLLTDMVDEMLDTPERRESLEDIINSVWYIAKKYSVDMEHSKYIEKISLSIFDQMKRLHKLGEKERIYLRAAAILHDIGKYINMNSHDIHSFNIIRYQDIMGFSERELNMIANIARYHSFDIPKYTDRN